MKKFSSFFSFVLVISCIWYTFYSSMPSTPKGLYAPLAEFSAQRAMKHVQAISKTQHFIGSATHDEVRDYISSALQQIGLQPSIQEGFVMTKAGQCARVQNIVTRIKGTNPNSKALLLLSHYDSAAHASFGASDAGSGVATILEGIRAFLAADTPPVNDIIICFTDGEEIGMTGAHYFVKHHPWISDIGLVLNFEARGSGGHSFMLLETNGKNGELITHFSKAAVPYPIANSLAYSIYKMLPNDTDLTVFREQASIPGFNFAFIDDHFDYHTANDTWQNLDENTLQHQGSYLMPLLSYFATTDLTDLTSDQERIYFNAPLSNMISYPFDWIWMLIAIGWGLCFVIIWYGKKHQKVALSSILRGAQAIGIALLITTGITYGGWKLLTFLYPQYKDILHGFPYNGHTYLLAFVSISIGICFKVSNYIQSLEHRIGMLIAALCIWLLICTATAIWLPGASYFIILAYFGAASLYLLVRNQSPNAILLVALAFPALYIVSPFIAQLPVALGLRFLFSSSILIVLLFSLLIPIMGMYRHKKRWRRAAYFIGIVSLIVAHFSASFDTEHPKPNSLLYFLDADQRTAAWATYDHTLDPWTRSYISETKNELATYRQQIVSKKYRKMFTHMNTAPIKPIPAPDIRIQSDTVINSSRYLQLRITPMRALHRIDLFTDRIFNFESLTVNGTTPPSFKHKDGTLRHAFTQRWSKNLLNYTVTNQAPLTLDLRFHKDSLPRFICYTSSYDLLKHPLFSIPPRDTQMMPKPFLINDAITVKKSFVIETYQEKVVDTLSLDIKVQ